MKSFTFYEQVGVVIPGAVFLFGVVLVYPAMRGFFADTAGMTLGALGVFVLLSYAAGHAVAAVGNVVEKVFWAPAGGMPSNWVVRRSHRLLNASQFTQLLAKIRERLNLDLAELPTKRRQWEPVFWPAVSRRLTRKSGPGRNVQRQLRPESWTGCGLVVLSASGRSVT